MEKKIRKRMIVAVLLLLGGNLLLFWTIWLMSTYDQVTIDQILYQMQTPADGAHKNLLSSAFVRVGVFGFALTALEILIYRKAVKSSFFKKHYFTLAMLALTLGMGFFSTQMDVFQYVEAVSTESDFIKKKYVDPNETEITFPEEKRNLIYIFLESMENTYSDPAAGGNIIDNFIPELTELSEENINFSNTTGVGGAYMYTGATWTAAAMVSQTSGVVIKVPLTADTYSGENGYMPGITSIGEILEKEGYNQTLLLGSDAAFAARDSYFTEHGHYNIVDINSLKEEGRLPEDYREWWGFEDQKLFGYAKEELTKLYEAGEPFNFTMLTADTHFPDGYLCPLCGDEYEEQYANVLSCSSKQVYEFIQWIQEQPFYENTTIVISGDHLTMDPAFLDEIDEEYDRTIYNCIINSAVEPIQEKERKFAGFDMFPTTLAAMGVELEDDRLGLGTNLFSDQPTLTEKYGFEALDEELHKNSEFYNKEFLNLAEEET